MSRKAFSRACGLALAVLSLCAVRAPALRAEPALPAQDAPEIPFSNANGGLADQDFQLLSQQGYRFDAKGFVYPKGSERPVSRSDFAGVLEEARSRQRLKALLEVNIILSRNNYSDSMPEEDRNALRRIGNENWRLLSKHTRQQLSPFYSARELAELSLSQPEPMSSEEVVDRAPKPEPSDIPAEPAEPEQAPVRQLPAPTPVKPQPVQSPVPPPVQPPAPVKPPAPVQSPAAQAPAAAAPAPPAVKPAAAPTAAAAPDLPGLPTDPDVRLPAPWASEKPAAPGGPKGPSDVAPGTAGSGTVPAAMTTKTVTAPSVQLQAPPRPAQAAPVSAPVPAQTPVQAPPPAVPPAAVQAAPVQPPAAAVPPRPEAAPTVQLQAQPQPAWPGPGPTPSPAVLAQAVAAAQASAPTPAQVPAQQPAPVKHPPELAPPPRPAVPTPPPGWFPAPPIQQPAAVQAVVPAPIQVPPAAAQPAAAAAPAAQPQTAPASVQQTAPPAVQAATAPPPAETNSFRAEPAAPPPAPTAPATAPLTLNPLPAPKPAAASAPSRPSPPVYKKVEYPEFDAKTFAGFLESAPYGRDVKPLLKFLADTLQEPERRIVLGSVVQLMPHIVLDSRKAGSRSRYALSELPQENGSPRWQIALNDGPVATEVHKLLGEDKVLFLPDEPTVFGELGAPVPGLQALPRQNPYDKEGSGRWGPARFYSDGSQRLSRSQEQLAGTLLHALMDLDGRLRGWQGEFYGELRATAAEFRFYALWEKATDKKVRLDRDLEGLFGEWVDRPEDYFDHRLGASDVDWSRASAGILAEAKMMTAPPAAAGASYAPATAGSGAAPAARGPEPPAAGPAADPEAEKAWLSEERLARESL